MIVMSTEVDGALVQFIGHYTHSRGILFPGGMPMPYRFLAGAGLVDRLQGQGYFDELFAVSGHAGGSSSVPLLFASPRPALEMPGYDCNVD